MIPAWEYYPKIMQSRYEKIEKGTADKQRSQYILPDFLSYCLFSNNWLKILPMQASKRKKKYYSIVVNQ